MCHLILFISLINKHVNAVADRDSGTANMFFGHDPEGEGTIKKLEFTATNSKPFIMPAIWTGPAGLSEAEMRTAQDLHNTPCLPCAAQPQKYQ